MKLLYLFLIQPFRVLREGMCVALLLVVPAVAASASDSLLSRKVSLTLQHVSLEDALRELGGTAHVKFVYSADHLRSVTPVSLRVETATLGEVLDELLLPRGIAYQVFETEATITLRKIPRTGSVQPAQPVTGQVVDANGMPMPGVSVFVKGTAYGVVTDAEGRFTLDADTGDVLVFSFIGYASHEQRVDERTVFSITLREEASTLEEVVINAGYWSVSDAERTGNISRVTAEDIQKQPVSNPLAALVGRMPGVFVQQGSGLPGGGFTFEIRGRNSVRTDGNDPLYLIDGVPFPATSLSQGMATVVSSNPLNAISSNDIASIEVLKDADATAIYGSRGANGVVLITTRKGRSGKTTFDVNISNGISRVAIGRMKMLSTSQYVAMRKEGFRNDNVAPTITNAPDLMVWDTTRYTNWRKVLIGGTAHNLRAQASVSGGTAQTRFMISGNYYKETTVFPGDFSFQRGSGHANLGHTSVDGRFSATFSATYTLSSNNLPAYDFTTNAFTLAPNAPSSYDENGKLNWEIVNGNNTWDNPLSFLGRTFQSNSTNLNSNTLLAYEVVKGLNIKTSFGYNVIRVDELQQNRASFLDPTDPLISITSAGVGYNVVKTWIAEPQLEYVGKIASGKFTALAGTTFNESIQEGQRLNATGFSSEALVGNINAASTVDVVSTNYTQYRYHAVFARINYNWKERYIVNLTGRRDGSSRFGPGNRFANFGAVGAAWIFSNESFIKNHVTFLSQGKLRASYGITGSDQIGDYRYLDTYEPTYRSYGLGGLQPVRLANPDYGWEENKKFEVGLETGFFNDRIFTSFSYFRNRSSNQLVGLPLPVMTGFEVVQFNLPATIQNSGLEAVLNATALRTTHVTWNTSLNITFPRSKVVSFPGLHELSDFVLRFVEGEPINTSQRYRFTGLDRDNGTYTFADINGDGMFDRLSDAKSLVQVGPQYYGGINNSFQVKGFQLDFFFQFVKQRASSVESYFVMPGRTGNQPASVMDRWQAPGDDAPFRKFSATGSQTNYWLWQASDNAMSDASYIRLQNVSLGWQFPQAWVSKAKLTGSRIYVQAQNLLTFTSYHGPDPETKTIFSLPPMRTITLGIHVTL